MTRPGWLIAPSAPGDGAQAEGSAELRAAVQEAIEELSDTYRDPMGRFLLTDSAPDQIAAELGLSSRALHVRVTRGLEHLVVQLLPQTARRAGIAPVPQGAASHRRGSAPGRRLQRRRPSAAPLPRRRRRLPKKSVGLTAALIAGVGAAMVGWMLASPDSTRSAPLDRDELSARATEASERLRRREIPTGFLAAPQLVEIPPPEPPRTEPREPVASTQSPDASLSGPGQMWLEAFGRARTESESDRVAGSLAALPATDALSVAREVFPRLTVEQRERFHRPFQPEAASRLVLELADLQATDPVYRVQAQAWETLRSIAFRDLGVGASTYPAWRDAVDEMSLGEAVRFGARSFARRALQATEADRPLVLEAARPPASAALRDVVAAALASTDFAGALSGWLAAEDPALRSTAEPWGFVLEHPQDPASTPR